MSARFLSLIFVVCLFFFSGVTISLAQGTPDAYANSTVSNVSKSTDNLLIGITHTFSCLAEGKSIIGTPCFASVDNNSVTSTLQENGYLSTKEVPSLGAVGMSQALILGLFTNPPIRSADYLANFGEQFGLTKPVYAQVGGSGNAVISPILNLWQLTRNIAYLVLIIIFIVVGFMIMFKSKINPQTVIGVQNAIPGLIIGLILITFSYFLSALLIDMTFVGTQVAGQILESTKPPIIGSGKTQEVLQNDNVLSIFNSFIKFPFNLRGSSNNISNFNDKQKELQTRVQEENRKSGSTSTDALDLSFVNKNSESGDIYKTIPTIISTLDFFDNQGLVSALIDRLLNIIGCQYGGAMGARIGKFADVQFLGFGVGGPAEAGGWFAGCGIGAVTLQSQKNTLIAIAFYLILMIALIVAMFKLLFSLISSYISIIIMTIGAPFYFLIGSMPGKGSVVGGWFNSMLANILVFPAVFMVFVFAAYLVQDSTNKFGTVNGIGAFSGSTLPMMGGFPPDVIRIILAYGVLLISPAVPEMVKGAFKVKGDNFGKTGMGNFMGGFTLGQGAGAQAYSRFWKGGAKGNELPKGPLGKGYGDLTEKAKKDNWPVINRLPGLKTS
ncbi:MAG: hypothetical protein Q7R43_03315 [Candidatus Daviesbacteria bacterium]|nr:hypothetical protein [Candidatus Daviesbacteria bacterium]